MNESDYIQLQEASWRRKLTAAEKGALQAWLSQHPEAQADWEMDRQLTSALNKLPDVPVPSNFTARVLQAVEREAGWENRVTKARPNWIVRLLLPRVAVATVILGASVLALHEHNIEKRAELVQGVKVVAGVPSLPGPEILQDFDTIRQMSTTPGADPELIALMK